MTGADPGSGAGRPRQPGSSQAQERRQAQPSTISSGQPHDRKGRGRGKSTARCRDNPYDRSSEGARRVTWSYAAVDVDEHDRKHAAFRELSEADRAYRAAFDEQTSLGGLEPSSFDRLLASVKRLQEVVERLRDTDEAQTAATIGDHAPTE